MSKFEHYSDVTTFIHQNPQRFLDTLSQNATFRDNFAELLKNAPSSIMIDWANALQSNQVRHPLTGTKMLHEPFSKGFAAWLRQEQNELNENPYHKIENPKGVFDYIIQHSINPNIKATNPEWDVLLNSTALNNKVSIDLNLNDINLDLAQKVSQVVEEKVEIAPQSTVSMQI